MDSRYFETYPEFSCLSGCLALTTTRAYYDDGISREALAKTVFKDLHRDIRQAVWPVQSHSGTVHFTRDSGAVYGCDGLITDREDRILLLRTADCVPVFLAGNNGMLRGLVHAGWRGLEKGIVFTAVTHMQKLGMDIHTLIVATGPSICKDCYTVGEDVACRFPGCTGNSNGRITLDLQAVIRNQLVKAGVSEKNILLTNQCTRCQIERYVSYRYNRTSNRLLSVLGK